MIYSPLKGERKEAEEEEEEEEEEQKEEEEEEEEEVSLSLISCEVLSFSTLTKKEEMLLPRQFLSCATAALSAFLPPSLSILLLAHGKRGRGGGREGGRKNDEGIVA